MSTLRQFALIALAAVILAAPVQAQTASQKPSPSITEQEDISISTSSTTPPAEDDDVAEEPPAKPAPKR